MKTFREFLKIKEDSGLFTAVTPSGDTTARAQLISGKDVDMEPVKNGNSGFKYPSSGGAGPSPGISRMKKMKKDGGEDKQDIYTGTLSGGLGSAQPVRMKKSS